MGHGVEELSVDGLLGEDLHFGRSRHELAFKAVLTDDTGLVLGYQFCVEVDRKVPDCGVSTNLLINRMDFIQEQIYNWVDVREKDVVNLTLFETALMMAEVEFNGMITGGDVPVKFDLITVDDCGLPLTLLEVVDGYGTIKQQKHIKIVRHNEDGSLEVKSGFEKWFKSEE